MTTAPYLAFGSVQDGNLIGFCSQFSIKFNFFFYI